MSDDELNLITLGSAHHQRCVHEGVIRIAGRAPDALVFEMPLGRFRSGDRVVPFPAGARPAGRYPPPGFDSNPTF